MPSPSRPVQRVVFLGAESTGKTTLARAVAEALGEPYVEEVGRRPAYYRHPEGHRTSALTLKRALR